MTIGKRTLGRTGLEVSALGLGCMGMSQSYGTAEERDERESLATIDRALELGVTFFDTAEVYGPFHNEELLGRALKGRRDARGDRHQVRHAHRGRQDGRRRTAARSTFARRSRARSPGSAPDRIDLLLPAPRRSRRADRGRRRRDGEAGARGQGPLPRTVGGGEQTIRRAHAVHPIAALQSEYSLWERNLEAKILPALRELGIGLVPFSPLGRGFLTGDVKRAEDYPPSDYRRIDPRFQGENFDANLRAASAVREVAAAKHATPGQIALAWLLAKGDDVVPIPGTKRRRYLEENVAAAEVRLDAAEIARLDAALAPEAIAGPRYNERMMSFIDR